MESPQNRPERLNSAEAVGAQFRVAIDLRPFNRLATGFVSYPRTSGLAGVPSINPSRQSERRCRG